MDGFVSVGRRDEVPEGEIEAFDVRGTRVAVANVNGSFYAFDDTCTHRECSLSEGEIDGEGVVCACHAGYFHLRTGAVLGGPPEAPIRVYPVRVEGDDLLVGPSEPAVAAEP